MEFGHFGGASNVDIFRYLDFIIFQGFLPTKSLDQRMVVSYIYSFFLQLMKPFSNADQIPLQLQLLDLSL